MKKLKTIGLLGGMGPAASAESYRDLVGICQKMYHAVDDADFPTMIIYSLPLSEFTHAGFVNKIGGKIFDQLMSALLKMEKAGAELIVMDCNTVHCFYEELQAGLSIPIVNLIDVTVKHAAKKKKKSVGILSSRTSRRLGLYEAAFEKHKIRTIAVTDAEQKMIDRAIHAAMGGIQGAKEIQALAKIIDRLVADGAEAIIFGCTEISLLLKDWIDDNLYIDSQWLALKHAVAKSYSK